MLTLSRKLSLSSSLSSHCPEIYFSCVQALHVILPTVFNVLSEFPGRPEAIKPCGPLLALPTVPDSLGSNHQQRMWPDRIYISNQVSGSAEDAGLQTPLGRSLT